MYICLNDKETKDLLIGLTGIIVMTTLSATYLVSKVRKINREIETKK